MFSRPRLWHAHSTHSKMYTKGIVILRPLATSRAENLFTVQIWHWVYKFGTVGQRINSNGFGPKMVIFGYFWLFSTIIDLFRVVEGSENVCMCISERFGCIRHALSSYFDFFTPPGPLCTQKVTVLDPKCHFLVIFGYFRPLLTSFG